jgi:hypothetical protein
MVAVEGMGGVGEVAWATGNMISMPSGTGVPTNPARAGATKPAAMIADVPSNSPPCPTSGGGHGGRLGKASTGQQYHCATKPAAVISDLPSKSSPCRSRAAGIVFASGGHPRGRRDGLGDDGHDLGAENLELVPTP